MPKLKPCPFCGSEAVIMEKVNHAGQLMCVKIACSKPLHCGAEISRWFWWDEVEQAYIAWNRRAGKDVREM